MSCTLPDTFFNPLSQRILLIFPLNLSPQPILSPSQPPSQPLSIPHPSIPPSQFPLSQPTHLSTHPHYPPSQPTHLSTHPPLPAGRVYDQAWDASKALGCLCDAGYRGPSCEFAECPSGPDPMDGYGNTPHPHTHILIYKYTHRQVLSQIPTHFHIFAHTPLYPSYIQHAPSLTMNL